MKGKGIPQACLLSRNLGSQTKACGRRKSRGVIKPKKKGPAWLRKQDCARLKSKLAELKKNECARPGKRSSPPRAYHILPAPGSSRVFVSVSSHGEKRACCLSWRCSFWEAQ